MLVLLRQLVQSAFGQTPHLKILHSVFDHYYRLGTENEILSHCSKADCVLEWIPSREFLGDDPGRLLCRGSGDEGVVLVVLQTGNIRHHGLGYGFTFSHLWNDGG